MMIRTPVIVVALLVMSAIAAAQTKTSSTSWCDVEYPAVAVLGDTFEVKVTPGDVPAGMKIAVDLHWSSRDQSQGGFLMHTERQEAVSGKACVFRFNLPVRDGIGAIRPIVFLTPDGSFESRTEMYAVPAVSVGTRQQREAAGNAAATRKASANWCEVEYPAVAVPGDTIEIKVTPREVQGEMKLAVDLHWSSKDQAAGGFLAYAERQPAQSGKPRVFHFRIAERENLGFVRPIVFLTPDGSFDNRTEQFNVPPIPVGTREQQQAAGATAVRMRKASSDWCDMEYPSTAKTGDVIEVKVTPRDVEAGMKLAVDLHWSSRDQKSGGFLTQTDRQDALNGSTCVFHFRIPARENMGTILPIVFISPDGSFENRKAQFNAPGIAVEEAKQESAAAEPAAPKAERPASATYRKSWIWIQPVEREVTENDTFDLTVEYYLDPSDHWGGSTKLAIVPLGPWIDNPDGKYTTQRMHISYYGLWPQSVEVSPGRNKHTFTLKTSKLYPFNSLHFLARFEDANGGPWPWDIRGGGVTLIPARPYYTLGTAVPGNLFTYDQQPHLQIRFADGAIKGESRTLRYTVVDTAGQEFSGEHVFVSGAPGEVVEFPLELKRRGISLIEAEVDGWGRREMTIGWIPNVQQVVNGKPTPFGVTNVSSAEASRIAQRLGFSWVRHFTSWASLQPAPDVWKLEGMDRVLQTNREYGLMPWICLIGPPAWVQTDEPRNVGYAPYAFDPAALAQSVRVMSERWKGLIWGWEWQNEIVPGNDVPDPVANYLEFCRVGTEAARSVDPSLRVQMAGGLWPRNFRAELLKRGIANYVDVVPVHYSNLDGVRDAQEDIAAAGAKHVGVWDNETARGLSVWKMPLREMLQVRIQSRWVMDRWPDLLVAGAEQVTYFGGGSDPCGNWSYLLDESTPRPVAATLAVLISKLSHAQPIGKFYHSGGTLHLFAKDRRAILVASPYGDGAIRGLRVSSPQVTIVDYQGNETSLATPDGLMDLQLTDMPVFVEGADLATLKSYLVMTVGTSTRPRPLVQLTAVQGEPLEVPLQLQNLYDTSMTFHVSLVTEEKVETVSEATVTLTPGERKVVQLRVDPSQTARQWLARIAFVGSDLPAVERPFQVTWINPSMLGNLLKNGGFEAPSASAAKPEAWWLSEGVQRIASDGRLGTGKYMLKYQGRDTWLSASQSIPFTGGQSFLYTAWAQTHNVRQGGSNVTYVFANGKKQDLYIPHVFQTPPTSKGWQLLIFRGNAPESTKELSVTPLMSGADGSMLLDNVRVTLYEGSNFAAEARRAAGAPKIDGDLSDWVGHEPIPLLAENQLTRFSSGYDWTPENLSGVAYLQWDEQALYLAVDVIDDRAATPFTDDRTPDSDSVTLAIQPNRIGKDANHQAFAYYLSAATPGGGSGRVTLYRPPAYAGGLPSGQLARDSSVYEVQIRRNGTRTTYEARLPWSELGGVQPRLGMKLGLSIRLDDNDGDGRAAAMTWGDGLEPAWEPSMFGVLTLTN